MLWCTNCIHTVYILHTYCTYNNAYIFPLFVYVHVSCMYMCRVCMCMCVCFTIAGDGRLGYPDDAPYDAIHVGAAAATIPQPVSGLYLSVVCWYC